MIKSESYKRGVFFSTILNVLAKGIGFINTLLLSYFFGTSASTDVYFYILAVAMLITSMINGIDYYVLIPEAMKIKEKAGEKFAQQFINFFIYIYLIIATLFLIVGFFSPIFFYTFFSKYDVALLSNNINLLYLGSIIILFQLINNLLSAVLISYKYFTATIISGLINSIFSIIFTILFHDKLGIQGTILGVTIGYVINFIILVFILIRYQHWNFKLVKWLKDKRIWKNIALMQLNILPVWVRGYFAILFLTGMGAGVLTSLNLAQMLAALPEIFILTQITSIVGIKFSELAATNNYIDTDILLQNLIKTLFIIILPIAVAMVVANKEIVQIAFERGNFKANSISITAFCFTFFSILLPSKIFDVLFSRLFTSFQLYGISTIFAVIAHSIITTCMYVLVKGYGLPGYFYSLLFGYYFIMPLAFVLIIKYKMKMLQINNMFIDVFKLIAIAVVVYFITVFILPFLPSQVIVKTVCISAIIFLLFFSITLPLIDCSYQLSLVNTVVKKYFKK